jgi:hypothetical protein
LSIDSSKGSAARRDRRLASEYEKGAGLNALAIRYFGSSKRVPQVLYVLGRQGTTLRPEDAPEEWREIERSDEDDLSLSIQLPAWLLAELGLDPENNDLEGRWELDELLSGKRLLLSVRKAATEEETEELEKIPDERCSGCGWEGTFMQLTQASDGWRCPKCATLLEKRK